MRIVVSGTGRGMASEVIDRAFEPFFTTKEAGKGSGLGLSQVYGSITQARGYVLIDSSLGAGTPFSLHVPRSDQPARSSAAAGALAQAAPGGSEKVLIVDEVREVAALIISDLGYQVLSAADGAQALALINRTRDIDLMVSDIVMSSGMDGVELARRARELRPGPPILLMSGFPMKTGSTETSEFPVLPKPYRRDALARQIRAALGKAIASAPALWNGPPSRGKRGQPRHLTPCHIPRRTSINGQSVSLPRRFRKNQEPGLSARL